MNCAKCIYNWTNHPSEITSIGQKICLHIIITSHTQQSSKYFIPSTQTNVLTLKSCLSVHHMRRNDDKNRKKKSFLLFFFRWRLIWIKASKNKKINQQKLLCATNKKKKERNKSEPQKSIFNFCRINFSWKNAFSFPSF